MLHPNTLQPPPAPAQTYPTLWGLTPVQLHDRFWAARGVQVVRLGEPSVIVSDADLFLLTEARTLVLFRLRDLMEVMCWMRPHLLFVRVNSKRSHGYQEIIQTTPDGRFVRFQRLYDAADNHLTRVAFTADADLAHAWQTASSSSTGWKTLRRQIPREEREISRVNGEIFDRAHNQEVAQFVNRLVTYWPAPSATVQRARRFSTNAWVDGDAKIDPQARIIGSVWVGAGRNLKTTMPVVGPAVLWDDPAARPVLQDIQWQELEPTESFVRPARPRTLSSFDRIIKRLFDIVFAVIALLLTLPFYPFIMLAIYLEDGRPFFFVHPRETLGGRQFGCIKFRSMRKDADEIKAQLAVANQADGPQFFIKKDPRLTRVGRLLRDLNIDEFPQFFNILVGDMSVVGPRPSPRTENQYCPPWREARLSVRPGITGLWQVKRTRRQGLDFQEWIKFDIQYVEQLSWKLDLWIIFQTFIVLLRGVFRR
ncbi:MAG: sugar transferase [Phycisphaerae bacterium]